MGKRRKLRQSETKIRRKAAQLIADDRLTDQEIADQLGVGRATLARWKLEPLFQRRVQEFTEAYATRILNHGIARKERRIEVLNVLHEKMLQVIDERATDKEVAHVAGGTTGLIVKNIKGIGKGEDFQVVEVFEVDTGVLRELRAVQDQVADEVGNRIKKHEVAGPGGGPIPVSLLSDTELEALARGEASE